jgi:hypothetical protein
MNREDREGQMKRAERDRKGKERKGEERREEEKIGEERRGVWKYWIRGWGQRTDLLHPFPVVSTVCVCVCI